MKARALLSTLAVLALALTACANPQGTRAGGTAGSSPTSGSATETAPGGTSPSGTTTGGGHEDGDGDGHAPPFTADTAADYGRPSAETSLIITDVRIGHHDGFDRVVFEFHGTGTPGWTVRYVPAAVSPTSGLPVPVAGNAVLDVAMTGVRYPTDTETDVEEFPRGRVAVAATDVVTEAYLDSTFEGICQAFVGTTGKQPFRVYLLTGPARVVLEVASR